MHNQYYISNNCLKTAFKNAYVVPWFKQAIDIPITAEQSAHCLGALIRFMLPIYIYFIYLFYKAPVNVNVVRLPHKISQELHL